MLCIFELMLPACKPRLTRIVICDPLTGLSLGLRSMTNAQVTGVIPPECRFQQTDRRAQWLGVWLPGQ